MPAGALFLMKKEEPPSRGSGGEVAHTLAAESAKNRVWGWGITVGFAVYLRTWPWQASQRVLVGTPAQVTERLRQYIGAGITHVIFIIPPLFDPHVTLRRFATEVMPAFRTP
jgi:alkanesulfonate monooxygenase SsuD/methylene tetrahydromethanopterin reductase-like flavin-dependent oxidoreductase (luciferase family)